MKKKEKKPYFTADLQENIRKMTVKQMNSFLLDLSGMDHWIAVLKYVQDRSVEADNILKITDPVKDPSKISIHQGIILGLSDIINAIVMLREDAQKKELPIVEETPLKEGDEEDDDAFEGFDTD